MCVEWLLQVLLSHSNYPTIDVVGRYRVRVLVYKTFGLIIVLWLCLIQSNFTLVDFSVPTRDHPMSHAPAQPPLCEEVSELMIHLSFFDWAWRSFGRYSYDVCNFSSGWTNLVDCKFVTVGDKPKFIVVGWFYITQNYCHNVVVVSRMFILGSLKAKHGFHWKLARHVQLRWRQWLVPYGVVGS